MFHRIVADSAGNIDNERLSALFQAHPIQINVLLELGP